MLSNSKLSICRVCHAPSGSSGLCPGHLMWWHDYLMLSVNRVWAQRDEYQRWTISHRINLLLSMYE